MTRRLLNRIILHLHLISSAQVHAAVRTLSDVEFDMQLEIAEWTGGDQLRAVPRTHQGPILHLPRIRIFFVWLPSAEVLAIEQGYRPSPLRSSRAFERRCSLSRPWPGSSVRAGGLAYQPRADQLRFEHHVILAIFRFLGRNKRELLGNNLNLRQRTRISPTA